MAQIIEAGTYQAKAREGALGETSGGKEQVAVRFELVDLQQSLTWYGYFTEKTTESTFKALRTAGWKGNDISDLSDLSKEDVPLVHLVVEHETDQGGTVRAKVRWVNSAGGMGLKAQLPADKAKAFAARMRGQLAAFDKKDTKPKADQGRVPQEVLDAQESQAPSGDLPF